jgi:hypothetical protein
LYTVRRSRELIRHPREPGRLAESGCLPGPRFESRDVVRLPERAEGDADLVEGEGVFADRHVLPSTLGAGNSPGPAMKSSNVLSPTLGTMPSGFFGLMPIGQLTGEKNAGCGLSLAPWDGLPPIFCARRSRSAPWAV